MKLASIETLSCDAGWRPWLFVKATTDDGLVGWSEVTDSHGSPTGLAGVVREHCRQNGTDADRIAELILRVEEMPAEEIEARLQGLPGSAG